VSMITVPRMPAGAACKGSTTDFFPEKTDGGSAIPAKKICAQCPALIECLEGALHRREEHGIWGGAGEDLRRWMGRAHRVRAVDPAGWAKVLELHLRALDGEDVGVVNRNGPGATCGLRVTYNRGCRCVPCMYATKDDVASEKRLVLVNAPPKSTADRTAPAKWSTKRRKAA